MKNAVLWKRILNEGCIYDCGDPDLSEDAFVAKIITSQIVVDSRTGPVETRDLNWRSLKRLAIPFEYSWIEGCTDKGQLWGSLLEVKKNGTGYEVICRSVAAGGAGPCCTGAVRLQLDKDASLVNDEIMDGALSRHMLLQYPRETLWTAVSSGAYLGLDVLLLLGCKNVSLEPRDNDPKQVRRAIKRHGNQSHGYRYHVLVVRPPGARSDAPAQEIGVMPRHVCRGHFAEYGPEFNKGLLFGKYAGRFYIPPHLKGKKENGEVAKDYQIGGVA